MDAITSKIYNAFEFAQRLSELSNLCISKVLIDDILLVLKELNIKSNSYFPRLKITQIFTKKNNEQYAKNILFALMLINKVNGLSIYNHNFIPEKST